MGFMSRDSTSCHSERSQESRHTKSPGLWRSSAPLRLAMLLVRLCCRISSRTPASLSTVGYFGPTEPMAPVDQKINQDNAAIPALRAAGNFEATVVQGDRQNFVNGDVTLL